MPATLKEFTFWPPPPYPCTLVDHNGIPIGTGYPDGTYTLLPTSNIPRSVEYEGQNFIVLWDGTNVDPTGGTTKGRLLPTAGPSYVDSIVAMRKMNRVADEEYIDEERLQGDVSGETPTSRPTGSPKTITENEE